MAQCLSGSILIRVSSSKNTLLGITQSLTIDQIIDHFLESISAADELTKKNSLERMDDGEDDHENTTCKVTYSHVDFRSDPCNSRGNLTRQIIGGE